jgi:hypothetical protein
MQSDAENPAGGAGVHTAVGEAQPAPSFGSAHASADLDQPTAGWVACPPLGAQLAVTVGTMGAVLSDLTPIPPVMEPHPVPDKDHCTTLGGPDEHTASPYTVVVVEGQVEPNALQAHGEHAAGLNWGPEIATRAVVGYAPPHAGRPAARSS